MTMTFVAGGAADVFTPDFAGAVEGELRKRFPELPAMAVADAYRSEEVDATGWSSLQRRVGGKQMSADPYQLVYLPLPLNGVEQVAVPSAADPVQAGSLPALLDELRAFAATALMPTDDLELMQLAAKYLEDDALYHRDLDVQTYVQLLLSAKQAAAHGCALWVTFGA